MRRTQDAYAIVLLQCALVRIYGVFKFPTLDSKNPANNVSVFLFTLESTTLLLKSFHLHLRNGTCVLLCSLKPILGIVTVQNLQEADHGVQFRKVSARTDPHRRKKDGKNSVHVVGLILPQVSIEVRVSPFPFLC